MESRSLPTSQYRGGCTIPLFQLSVWCEKYVAAWHYSVIGKQLKNANRNRVRGAVLCLSQDGACTNLFENFSENSWKGDLSNNTTENPPLFSLVNTFKHELHYFHPQIHFWYLKEFRNQISSTFDENWNIRIPLPLKSHLLCKEMVAAQKPNICKGWVMSKNVTLVWRSTIFLAMA